MKNEEFLDGLIDQVAGELTGRPSRHGFAARVRERLEARSPLSRWRWSFVAGAAAAAALAVWFVLPATTTHPVGSREPRSFADRVLPTPAPAISLPATNREHGRAGWSEAPRPQLQTRSALRIPVDPEGVPQLAAIAPPADLALEPIQISDLTIAPLEPEKESR